VAVQFNHTPNDHINMGDWDISGSDITLMAWVLFDSIGHPYDPRIICKGVGVNNNDHYWNLLVNSGTDKPAFRLHNGSDMATVNATTVMALNTWYHLAARYDGTAMKIYVNGVREGCIYRSGSIRTGTAEVWLGDQPGDPVRPHHGLIEDARVYKRSLPFSEIETIYAARGSDNIVYGIESRWRLGEGAPGVVVPATAGTIKDLIGNHHGTQSGDPTFAEGYCRRRRAFCG